MSDEATDEGIFRLINSGMVELERFLADKKLVKAAQQAFKNRRLGQKELFAIVPPGVVQALVVLSVPPAFKQMREASSPEMRPKIEQLREQAVSLFSGVEDHPAVLQRVREVAKKTPSWKNSGLDKDFSFNAINSISWIPLWIDTNEQMTPVVRISLKEEPYGQLLDTTLNLDGLTYVVTTLLTILADELDRTMEFTKEIALLDSLVNEVDGERINKLRESFKRVDKAWNKLQHQEESAPTTK